jgi:anti-sigma regulatory factor (Ser/Thr protein kinase)
VSHHALSITCSNRLAEIEKATELIEAFGTAHGLSAEVVFKLNLALDEVVTNIISHAYDDEDEHQIAIRVALDGEGVAVRVEDDGRAFNPLDAPRPDLGLDLANRPIGGLGVHIVRSVMDALEYRRENDRNILIMRKRTGDGSNEGARRIE